MQTRVVVVALVSAAVLGIFVGGVVALVAGDGDGDAQAEEEHLPLPRSATADPAPPAQPTRSPLPRTGPRDVEYVLDVNDQDGEVVLVFDRVTVLEGDEAEERAAERGESVQPGGWYLNNDNDRTRGRSSRCRQAGG